MKPPLWAWWSRLVCGLGIHGPEWFGHGLGVSSPRNRSIGPGVRHCSHCGAVWQAYEAPTSRPVRVLAWARVDQ